MLDLHIFLTPELFKPLIVSFMWTFPYFDENESSEKLVSAYAYKCYKASSINEIVCNTVYRASKH